MCAPAQAASAWVILARATALSARRSREERLREIAPGTAMSNRLTGATSGAPCYEPSGRLHRS